MDGETKETGPVQNFERAKVYRSSEEFVAALAKQLKVSEEKLFSVHASAERAKLGKDIHDPQVWVDAVEPTEDAKILNANMDSSSMYLHFSTRGEMPKNFLENEKSGTYIKLLIGRAKLMAAQREIPDTYATAQAAVARAIVDNQRALKEVVKIPSSKVSVGDFVTQSGQVKLGIAIPMSVVSASLILAACGTPVEASSLVPTDLNASGTRSAENINTIAPKTSETAKPTNEPAAGSTSENPAIVNRSEVANYNIEHYAEADGQYPDNIQKDIYFYTQEFLELNGKDPAEVYTLKNPGRETITILNFSTDTKIDPVAVGKTYDYFLTQAIKNQEYQYEYGVSYKVSVRPSPDVLIGLIPTDIAVPGDLAQTPTSYTNPSRNAGEPNSIYVRLWPENSMANTPKDIYPTRFTVSSYNLEVELCQATSETKTTIVPGMKQVDLFTWNGLSQEVYCNSFALSFFAKQKGFTYKKYVDFFKSRVKFFKLADGNAYPAQVFDEATYASIPIIKNSPLAGK